MDESQLLTSYLQSLRPNGHEGFEGLVAQLLEKLTGQRFYLAHAGSQQGRDMSTGGFNGTWIAVEAKRFHSPKSFDRRELLGELAELPDGIDLWIIASTTRVPDQIISVLRENAAKRGIEVETLDAPADVLGDLPVLCAAYEDTVVVLLQKGGVGREIGSLLEAIRRHPEFARSLESLQCRFRAGSIGYAQAQAASLAYLRSAFGNSVQARVELGQPINVLEGGGSHVVERSQALEALDSWWSSWSTSPRPFALLGEEGLGKTWALAAWLARRLEASDPALPLTLFLPSGAVGASRALDVIAGALAVCTGVRDARFWARRAEAFAQRAQAKRPALLLILDGLNEQPFFDWRTLLESLQIPPWKEQVALVLTCRPAYWHDDLSSGFQGSFRTFKIGPYDDEEFASALDKGGLQAADLPSTLEPLLRRPRYLDLTIQHRKALEESGDVTVDRLLYEDWKDRAARKRGQFSDQTFRAFLVRLAERHRDHLLSKREIQDLLPMEALTSLDEIITGGILVQDSLGRYAVEPRRLVQGLGLLLADQVRNQAHLGDSAMREAMASLLEPHADMDKKVAICRSAAIFAVLEPDFPEAARSVLLEQWIGNRNLSREDLESFTAHLPDSIDSYLGLVERFWATRRPHNQAQSLLVRTFFRWREYPRVQQSLIGACERWLSYVHPYGHFMRGENDAIRAKIRQEIEERAGQPLKPGSKLLLIDELEVTETDSSLWLAEPALLLASLFSVTPFIPALRRWALSRSVMGYSEEEESAVAAVLRWSDEDLWPTLEAVIGPLIEGPRVVQQAAWRLLWACGREEAASLLERLPKDLFPSYYEEAYAEDPCRPFWRREDCSMCAARPDLPDRLVALKLAPHALDPDLQIDFDVRPRLQGALSGLRIEQLSSCRGMTADEHDFQRIEPALAAFAPDLLAETYRALARDLPNRTDNDRGALLSRLGAMSLLLKGFRERRVLRTAWKRICRTETWKNEARFAENQLFTVLLFYVPARVQLDLLLRRPKEAFDDINLGPFKRLPPRHIRTMAQDLLDSAPRELQRKLWFLWYQQSAPVLEVLDKEKLVELFDHTDPETRTIAYRWLFRSDCDEVFDLAIERGKITPSLTRSMRQFWGGWFAVRMRSRLSYETLARAIDLGSLSYVIRRRPYDLASYIRDLDRAVQGATRALDDSLKTGFCEETLQAIVKKDRKVVAGWVSHAIGQRNTRSPLVRSCHMMLESLCEVLLETDPVQGVDLFKTLLAQRRHASTVNNPTGVDVLALTLFKIPRSGYADTLLREWFDNCTTDKALLEMALAASAVRRDDRLGELIQEAFSSPIPVKKAAALMLSGFAVHGSQSATLLESVQLHPEGWLHEICNWARRHLERDRWAQEWFRRFAISPGTEESFAAFRLFLRCVDRRYWAWKEDVLKGARPSSDRRRYLNINSDRIDRAIKDNEKDLEKRFLGYEIPEGKVWPWLSRYLG